MLTLFTAEICPYTQRTRALLHLLHVDYTRREVDLRNPPPDLLALSPTGQVPLMVDGDVKLYESQVINDYLSGLHSWPVRYPSDIALRARQKLAMKQWDSVVLPAFHRSMRDGGVLDQRRRAVEAELDELVLTIEISRPGVPSLLSFHLAPFWVRMDWLRELTTAASLIDARPALRGWLDQAVAHPSVIATLPRRHAVVETYSEWYANRPRLEA